MSEIFLYPDGLEQQMKQLEGMADGIDKVLGSMPPAVDGGMASALIAYIAGGGAEAAGHAADSYHVLSAIAMDVVKKDMARTEAEVQELLRGIEGWIEGS